MSNLSNANEVIITKTSTKVNSFNVQEKSGELFLDLKKCIIGNNFEIENNEKKINFVSISDPNHKKSNIISRKNYFFDKFFVLGVNKDNIENSCLDADNFVVKPSILYEYPSVENYEAHYGKIIQDFVFSNGIYVEKINHGNTFNKINEFFFKLIY